MFVDEMVSSTGIDSLKVDGFSDFFGNVGNLVGGGLLTAGGLYVNDYLTRQFPERVKPIDNSNGSTGSPIDTAIAEIKDTNEAKVVEKQSMQNYILYGVAGLALLSTVFLIARK